ncbi:MAG: helix-turn-helix domain-containing protein [bacterium]
MKNPGQMQKITAKAVNNSNEIGEIIRLHRGKANLTQLELAELSGVGKTVIFDIEKGKSTIKFETLLKVFKSLNISLFLDSPILGALVGSE